MEHLQITHYLHNFHVNVNHYPIKQFSYLEIIHDLFQSWPQWKILDRYLSYSHTITMIFTKFRKWLDQPRNETSLRDTLRSYSPDKSKADVNSVLFIHKNEAWWFWWQLWKKAQQRIPMGVVHKRLNELVRGVILDSGTTDLPILIKNGEASGGGIRLRSVHIFWNIVEDNIVAQSDLINSSRKRRRSSIITFHSTEQENS